jgi:hypothetical protein
MAIVERVYYAIKGDSLQIKRKDDDTNVIFSWRDLECLRVATNNNL